MQIPIHSDQSSDGREVWFVRIRSGVEAAPHRESAPVTRIKRCAVNQNKLKTELTNQRSVMAARLERQPSLDPTFWETVALAMTVLVGAWVRTTR